jgi:tellurite resistance protein
MSFEERAAYALASWQRFDSEVTDDLARAITSAFALVAVADGDLAQSELDRFILLVQEREYIFATLGFDRFDLLFRDIGAAIMSDPIAGRERALDLIAVVKADATHCELVRAAAEIAIFADDRELASEQEIMEQICKAMDIDVRKAV